ncbi:uncharacterized protein LOC125672633 [Ostrea edulis]|uniref:uncharacterized protein LOC125672633 n=1 Tax=Ostrea edulis TaxID=37623 RepID=UPI0024AEE821|nr:uncharacterized protein LOC125672633 [Ostrea edulis]
MYSVNGRKFMEGPIYGETINELLGPDTIEILREAGVSSCRSVFNVDVLKEKLSKGVAEVFNDDIFRPNVSQKRMAKSTREQMTCETPSNNTSEAVMRNKRTKKVSVF